jgi:hypothetical protein
MRASKMMFFGFFSKSFPDASVKVYVMNHARTKPIAVRFSSHELGPNRPNYEQERSTRPERVVDAQAPGLGQQEPHPFNKGAKGNRQRTKAQASANRHGQSVL